MINTECHRNNSIRIRLYVEYYNYTLKQLIQYRMEYYDKGIKGYKNTKINNNNTNHIYNKNNINNTNNNHNTSLLSTTTTNTLLFSLD